MPRLKYDQTLTHGFRAEIIPNLRQGDHQVVRITYTNMKGETRRMGNMILPDHLIAEFLTRFD